MARPKQFDEPAALDAAMMQFWDSGYGATSVRDLAICMKIAGTSIYNTFGDKKSLFAKSLARYFQKTYREPFEDITLGSARTSIEHVLRTLIDNSLSDSDHKGCLLINSAIEVAPRDEDLKEEIVVDLCTIEDFFRSRIKAGQAEGSIVKGQNADDLARLLLGALVSIMVLSRARPERQLLEGIIRPVFALLDGMNQISPADVPVLTR